MGAYGYTFLVLVCALLSIFWFLSCFSVKLNYKLPPLLLLLPCFPVNLIKPPLPFFSGKNCFCTCRTSSNSNLNSFFPPLGFYGEKKDFLPGKIIRKSSTTVVTENCKAEKYYVLTYTKLLIKYFKMISFAQNQIHLTTKVYEEVDRANYILTVRACMYLCMCVLIYY